MEVRVRGMLMGMAGATERRRRFKAKVEAVTEVAAGVEIKAGAARMAKVPARVNEQYRGGDGGRPTRRLANDRPRRDVSV